MNDSKRFLLVTWWMFQTRFFHKSVHFSVDAISSWKFHKWLDIEPQTFIARFWVVANGYINHTTEKMNEKIREFFFKEISIVWSDKNRLTQSMRWIDTFEAYRKMLHKVTGESTVAISFFLLKAGVLKGDVKYVP